MPTEMSFQGARLARPLVLAIDLDESFVEVSAPDSRSELFSLFEQSADDLRLVYMSHESAEKLIQLAAQAELPIPEVFMADSGTTVLKGDGTGTIEPLQRSIIQLWPGKEAVTKALGELDGVSLKSDDAPCRQGIRVESDESLEAVRSKIDEMGCHLEARGEAEWDVLPYGVDKGSTLGRWIVETNISPNSLLAIGEAEGDMCLFGRGWRGAVFAHAPEHLREEANRFHNVYILDEDGPKAVLQALRKHGWLELKAKA
jgi:hydroxymethylpyrimidine pyrophosphatase-like HAD family hydrolase